MILLRWQNISVILKAKFRKEEVGNGRWVNLVGVAPLLLGIMVFVPQMVVSPLVLAQTNASERQAP